jgi:transposase
VTRKAASPKQPKETTKANALVVSEPLPVPRELLVAGVVLDPELEIQRQKRMEALKAHLLGMIAQGKGEAAVDSVLVAMIAMEREVDQLGWRVLQATRYRFGRNTEKLSREELSQLYLAFGGDKATAASNQELPVPTPEQPEQVADGAKLDDAPTSEQPATEGQTKKKRNRVRSMKVAANVERNVTTVLVPQAERQCSNCGNEMKPFGWVDHETIKFVPAKLVIEVEHREKVGCDCRKCATTADRVATPAVIRKVDASFLAKLLKDKAAMSLPLDRQRREFGRLGLDICDKTLQSYWNYSTDLIEPVALATLSTVFGHPIVAADDSHLRTLDRTHKNGVFRGHIWCFVGTDGQVNGPEMVAYGYTKSWEATEIADWFQSIEGFIQVDGYAGYSREVDDDDGETRVAVPDDRRLGCGMHIRNKFHQALVSKDRRAAIPLKHLVDIYAIEAACKAGGLSADDRLAERQQKSLPLLDALDEWVDTIHQKLLPKSPLRMATTYAINQRPYFRRCFDDGRFEIDNGRCERRIRPFTVGRRNFLFTGSVRGGERLAVAYTLVDNCLILGIDPHAYLVDIITKLESAWPLSRLSELTPANWFAQQATK